MVSMKLTLPPLLDQIVRELHAAGYRAVVVGGAVRDALLGGHPKDFDIEVYGVAYDQLARILARHGRVDLVGNSFGVVKLTAGSHDYDFSVPRRDSKLGLGHRDFQTTFDSDISPREAASRRLYDQRDGLRSGNERTSRFLRRRQGLGAQNPSGHQRCFRRGSFTCTPRDAVRVPV